MRRDRELIFKLRQEGKSYLDIQKETGVSVATLSIWFKKIAWSKQISHENNKKNVEASKERVVRMNMVRALKLQYQYALVEAEAVKEYETFKREPLFWAGLMTYAGEGEKRSKGLIRISNSEFYMHRIFITFAKKYLKIDSASFRYALLLYPDLDEGICKGEWIRQLSVDSDQFHKTQVIKGKETVKRLQYGIGMSIISSTSLKKKLMKWLILAENEMF